MDLATLDQDTRDAVLIAMLEHPEHAPQIAEWASDPDNLDQLSGLAESLWEGHGGLVQQKITDKNGREMTVWVRPEEHPDAKTQAPAVGDRDGSEGHTKSRLRKLLDRAGEVATAVKDKVAGYVRKTYAKLESKYGKTGAKLVCAGMVALLPIPVPGTSMAPIAIAEGVKRLGILFGGRKAESVQESTHIVLDDGELISAVREALAELYAEIGEEMPELSDDDIRAFLDDHSSEFTK